MMKISFIVPMFNSEAYIGPCIESILDQGIPEDDFEIVVVDDGSTDNSATIVQRYSKVKYIFQPNGGLSVARNTALDNSTGDYICFVDSDDILVPNSISYCLNQAIECNLDMITYCIEQYEGNVKKLPDNLSGAKLSDITNGIQYLADNNYLNGVWWYLVKRECIGNLRFEVGHYWEDSMFTMELFLRENRIAHTDRKCYCYIRRPNSITRRLDKVHMKTIIQDNLYVYHYMRNLVNKNASVLTYEAKKRCYERSNSFLFFLFVRLLRFPDGEVLIKDTLKTLKCEGIYPIEGLNAKEYPGLKFRILYAVINHPRMLLLANSLYSFYTNISRSAE